MFVMIADIRLRAGAEGDFAKWFAESNAVLRGFPGFVSRRLLRSPDGGYRVLVEHESQETFAKMHQSPEHQKIHPVGRSFMEADPQKRTFVTVAE